MRTATRALGKLLAQPRRPIPPSQPSCSRWLTCSCCRPATFFSPNARELAVRKAPPIAPPSTNNTTGEPNPISKAHFLPLPPRLPYSPTSHPFRRHLEILSLSSISSTPEESWRIYLSLHPSLRRYIPDDVFRSLIAHQLSDPQPSSRWVRSRALIQFGQSCGMALDTLGAEVVRGALEAGLEYALEVKKDTNGMRGILEGLWGALVRLKKSDLSALELGTRRRWLEFHLLGVQEWQAVRARAALPPFPHQSPAEVVRGMVDCGASSGLEGQLQELLLKKVGGQAREALEVAIWCWRNEVGISDESVERLMLRHHREGGDVEGTVRKASVGTSWDAAERIDAALAVAMLRADPTALAAHLIAQPPPLPVTELVNLGLDIVRAKTTSDLDTAIDVCQHLYSHSAPDAEILYLALARKLEQTSHSPSPPSAATIRFAQTLFRASTQPSFLQDTLLSLLRLDSPEAYAAARTAYSAARPAGFRWSEPTRDLWRRIFHQAINPQTRQLHFASRLYADLIADGLQPSQRDILEMIRSIGMSRNASRPILLERHLRDYVDYFPSHLGPLAQALVSGLTASKSANDALLAWTLIKRLGFEEGDFPASPLVQCLATSGRAAHRQAMLEIVSAQAGQPKSLPELYDPILTSIITHARTHPDRHTLSHEAALTLASTILRDMSTKHIPPSPQIATALIRGLAQVNQLDNALALLGTVSKARIGVKSSAVGRLMVRLAMAERYEDAEEAERVWRSSLLEGGRDVYERGVTGAKVLMDLKRGRSVDLQQVRERTGWKPTKPFLAFLRSLEGDLVEEKAAEKAIEVEVEEVLQDEVLEDRREAEVVVDVGRREEVKAAGSFGQGVRLGYGSFRVSGMGYVAV